MEIDDSIEGVIFKPLRQYDDGRGWLIELFRHDELERADYPVMAYLSQTLPGVSRGPHEHTDQTDYLAFVGPADFILYLWDARKDSPTFGNRSATLLGESKMQAVIIPPGVVHGYKNVSDKPGLVFNGPNRLYAGQDKKEPVDEVRHEETADSPYTME
jgi:dTDP-4-dehydrorhamnose 3,5-epimerase